MTLCVSTCTVLLKSCAINDFARFNMYCTARMSYMMGDVMVWNEERNVQTQRNWFSRFADWVSEQVVAIIRLLDSPLAIVVFGWSRRCFERLRDRLVVAIQAPEQNDPLLGLLQLAVTSF